MNLIDHFNGQFKAGGLCWLCRFATSFSFLFFLLLLLPSLHSTQTHYLILISCGQR